MARSLLLLAATAFVGVWAYGQVSARPGTDEPARTPPSTAAITTQLTNLDRALLQAQQAGKAVPVVLTFTDADLTAAAASASLSSGGLVVRDPAVHVASGSLVLTGIAQAGPLSGALRVTATPIVASGHAVVRIDSATIGAIALPDAARSGLEASVQAALASLVPSRLQLTSIAASPGVLTIQGNALPA